MSKKNKNRSASIIIFSLLIIIIIYVAGLYTGIIFSKKIEYKTNADIQDLRQNITEIEAEIQTMQITEYFINSLGDNSCDAANIMESTGINEELSQFWSILPNRLEEYEQNNPLTPEYISIKNKYMTSSFRSWLILKNIYNKCNSSPVPILYFYSKDCVNCIIQGEILDNVSAKAKEIGFETRIYTIDYNTNNEAIELAKKYYDVTNVPTLIIGEEKISGDIILEIEILKLLK